MCHADLLLTIHNRRSQRGKFDANSEVTHKRPSDQLILQIHRRDAVIHLDLTDLVNRGIVPRWGVLPRSDGAIALTGYWSAAC